MRSHYRAIILAISVFAASAAVAQTNTGRTNPIARGADGEVPFYNPWQEQRGQVAGRGVLDNTGIGRPLPRNQQPVNPVPEPSQWAMMLAGLALVGVIVRRGSRGDS